MELDNHKLSHKLDEQVITGGIFKWEACGEKKKLNNLNKLPKLICKIVSIAETQ